MYWGLTIRLFHPQQPNTGADILHLLDAHRQHPCYGPAITADEFRSSMTEERDILREGMVEVANLCDVPLDVIDSAVQADQL